MGASAAIDRYVEALASTVARVETRTLAVVVGADGSVRDLKIADSAMSLSGEYLAASIVRLIEQARVDLAEQIRRLSAQLESDPSVVGAMESVVAEDVEHTEMVSSSTRAEDDVPWCGHSGSFLQRP